MVGMELACRDHRCGCFYLWPVCLTHKGWLCDGVRFWREKNSTPRIRPKPPRARSPRSSAQICAKSLQFVLHREDFSCLRCFHRIHCPDLHAQGGCVCQANFRWIDRFGQERGPFGKIHRSDETRNMVGRVILILQTFMFSIRVAPSPLSVANLHPESKMRN